MFIHFLQYDETRIVKHFQLDGWTDYQIPHDAELLLRFIYYYQEQVKLCRLQNQDDWNDAPIVVHCSTGVGRTAVFIVIDRIFR